MRVAHRLVLHFPPAVVEQPIVCTLARRYELDFNIMKASISPQEEGLMVVELSGAEADYEQGIQYLSSQGIRIQPMVQDIRKNDDRCVDCGACIGVCPTEALRLERPSMRVVFNIDLCVACGECVPTCPVRAMEVQF